MRVGFPAGGRALPLVGAGSSRSGGADHGTHRVQDHVRHDVGRQRGAARRLRGGRGDREVVARARSTRSTSTARSAGARGSTRSAPRSTANILVGQFGRATRQDAKDAIAAAKAFVPEWSGTPWQDRVKIMRQFADVDLRARVRARRAHGHRGRQEPARGARRRRGDRRPHPLLLQRRWRTTTGFEHPHGARCPTKEHNRSVLRPYGVWGVISPFNFPMALAGGPAGGALVAGNTVVLKPSHQGYFTALKLYEMACRGRRPGRGVPRADRAGLDGRRRDLQQPRRRRPDVHRLVRGGHADLPELRQGVPQAGHLRDGRQEPDHRHRPRPTWTRRPTASCGRRSASAGRSARRARACTWSARCTTTFVDQLLEKAAKLEVGNPLERSIYTGSGHQHQGRRDVRAGGLGREVGWRRGAPGRRADHRGRPGPGELRAADHRRGAVRQPGVEGRAVRAVRRRRARSTRSTRRWSWRTTPSTA